MKKTFAIFVLIMLVIMIALCYAPTALAEEGEDAIVENTESVENSEGLTKDETEEVVKNAVEKFLGQYMENSMIAKIISWMIDAGVLSALVIIYIRYRRVKNKTIEDIVYMARDKLGEAASETFGKVSGEINPQIIELQSAVIDLQYKLNAVLQAFALSQDKSADGKIAMLQLISRASDADEDMQDSIDKMQEEVKEEAAEVAAIEESVKEEYKPTTLDIF